MPTEIPSMEDFRRLEAKLDQLIQLLTDRKQSELIGQYIEKNILISKNHLNICGTTIRKYEKEGHFTPIKRGRKTYYPIEQYHAWLQKKSYKQEVIDKRLRTVRGEPEKK